MEQAFLDYYRCPDQFADFRLNAFQSDLPCDVPSGQHSELEMSLCSVDQMTMMGFEGATGSLPFNLSEVANSLRFERYVNGASRAGWKKLVREAYYFLRPALPVPIRRHLQRASLKGWDTKSFPQWPVDRTVDRMFETGMALSLRRHQCIIPFVWFWPEGKAGCAIMTHDVETASGLDFVGQLMDLDDSFGIKSSFQIIPESRYTAGEDLLSTIRQRGFEINVHDLKHDGHLFDDQTKFRDQAERINEYAAKFGSRGFRSGVLYRRLDWYDAFEFSYDMSVPNVGHLDPQPGGCCTVMPFYIGNILELPLTTVQDYSLFNILRTYSVDLWQQQIDLISKGHGLMSFNVHPDYLDNTRAKNTYKDLLHTLATLRATADLWTPLPGEVDSWWRQRSEMHVTADGSGWRIQGPGADRARLAFATLADDAVCYSLAPAACSYASGTSL